MFLSDFGQLNKNAVKTLYTDGNPPQCITEGNCWSGAEAKDTKLTSTSPLKLPRGFLSVFAF